MEDAGECDVCGLDGFLEFECGMQIAVYPERRKEFEGRVLPEVAKWFQATPGRCVSFAQLDEMRKQNHTFLNLKKCGAFR